MVSQIEYGEGTYRKKAREFAKDAHKDITRKHYFFPYSYHVGQVTSVVEAALFKQLFHLESFIDESEPEPWGGSYRVEDLEQVLAACELHDVIEDTKYTADDLLKEGFTKKTVDLVVELTNIDKSAGNREERNKINHERLRNASKYAKIIKAADRWCNINDLVVSLARGRISKGYYWKYLHETEHLVECIKVENYLVWEDLNIMTQELLKRI